MKNLKFILLACFLLLSLQSQAQGFKAYKNGQVSVYPVSEIDSMVFYTGDPWTNKTVQGHVAVDMGLPSGTYWAQCNVGAADESETAFGNFYSWGETEPKDVYSWATYTLGESSSVMNKYNATDSLTTLEEYDDAATVNWGSEWCMPTKAQIDELVNNCDWTWTTINGVTGYKIKSKLNTNTLFLPAAGYWDGTTKKTEGTRGYYWSCELNSVSSGRTIRFINDGTHASNGGSRYFGFPVRAVTK